MLLPSLASGYDYAFLAHHNGGVIASPGGKAYVMMSMPPFTNWADSIMYMPFEPGQILNAGEDYIDQSPALNDLEQPSVASRPSTNLNTVGLDFDGGNDYLTGGDNSQFDFGTNNFTLMMWAKPRAANAIGSIAIQKDLRYGGSATHGYALWYDTLANSRWTFRIDDGVDVISEYPATGTAPTNVWTHIAVVRHPLAALSGQWINGIKVPVTRAGAGLWAGDVSSTAPLEVGRNINSGGGPAQNAMYFNGLLDDVTVFPIALSSNAIYSISQSTLGGHP